VLNWVHTVQSGNYEVWYSPVPYFAISDPEAVKLSDIQGTTAGETLTFTHVGVAANNSSSFYLIRVTNSSGEVFSNQVGKVGFAIQPGQ
ncbi:MAG: hypothetical protein KDE56_33305, partial [Anaerolineales bacterium]|nr:hypothetical protein [Anaerolineales bacterium]